MTIKLTKSELQALEQELAKIINYQHMSFGDRLLIILLTQLYKRLVVKLLDLKKKYSLKMDEATELAFYLYFEDKTCIPTSFTDNLVKKICDLINQKHSS